MTFQFSPFIKTTIAPFVRFHEKLSEAIDSCLVKIYLPREVFARIALRISSVPCLFSSGECKNVCVVRQGVHRLYKR
jgi:hypothetical protein